MGMDVYGRRPSAEAGTYFRRNVWGWRPLADLCLTLAPEVCRPCKGWHMNDGDGLTARNAQALATALEAQLATGAIDAYVKQRDAALANLPDEPCTWCGGSGAFAAPAVPKDVVPEKVVKAVFGGLRDEAPVCGICEGKDTTRPFACNYALDAEDVREFAAFLKASGGFSIC